MKLCSKEAREFVYNATGKHYNVIMLKESDPLLSMLLIKFGSENEE